MFKIVLKKLYIVFGFSYDKCTSVSVKIQKIKEAIQKYISFAVNNTIKNNKNK